MDLFYLGFTVLGIMVAVFFAVLFGFMYYWHLKKITFVIVPALFTFEVLVLGVIITAGVAIAFHYIPQLISFLNL